MKYGAQTEYGKLRRVLMHRPTEENRCITPGNKDAYLFRDVVYWKEFQREHDVFTDTLRREGVDVVMLTDYIDAHHAEIAETLPNMVYTRDNCMVTSLGAHSLKMASAARHTESLIMEKAMASLGIPIANRVEHPGQVEGGGFVWLDRDTAMMGFITRSNESGVRAMRETLLGRGRSRSSWRSLCRRSASTSTEPSWSSAPTSPSSTREASTSSPATSTTRTTSRSSTYANIWRRRA